MKCIKIVPPGGDPVEEAGRDASGRAVEREGAPGPEGRKIFFYN